MASHARSTPKVKGASVPPASMTSTSPERILCAASPRATAEDEQAVEYVRFGPVIPWSMPIQEAAALFIAGILRLCAADARANGHPATLARASGEIEPRIGDCLRHRHQGELADPVEHSDPWAGEIPRGIEFHRRADRSRQAFDASRRQSTHARAAVDEIAE